MSTPNVFMGFTGVTIEHGATPTVIAFDESTKLMVEMSDSYETWRANGARFVRAMPIAESIRRVSIEGGDILKATTIPRGVPLSVKATLKHHKTGTGAGSIHFVGTPMVFKGNPVEAQTQKI